MLGRDPAGTSTPSPTTLIPGQWRSSPAASIGSPRRALGRLPRSAAAVDTVLVALVDRVTRRMRVSGRVGRTVVLRLRFDILRGDPFTDDVARHAPHTETILTVIEDRWPRPGQ